MGTCPRCCAALGTETPKYCPNCGAALPPSDDQVAAAPTPSSKINRKLTGICPNCKTEMSLAGELQFRVGGSTGAAGLLLGQWNQLSEQLQPFSVFHCPTCGRIDLYEPGVSFRPLTVGAVEGDPGSQ